MTRSVVVTGASQGIGRAIADRLDAEGWAVVGLDLAIGDGPFADVVEGDAARREAHDEAAARARAIAPLGGWVNNAGITRLTPLDDLDEDLVRRVVDVGGLGYVWGCAAAVAAFLAQGGGGSIVNIGSIHGRRSFADHAAYEFVKGGVDALTRAVAVSHGGEGVRANAIAPGAVLTPHLERQIREATDPAAEERALTDGPPLRRIVRPEEVAALAAFLLGDEAPSLSGQSIGVDAGWSAAFGKGG